MTLEGYRPLQARLTAIGTTKELMRLMGLETVRGAKHTVARKTGTTGRTIRMVGASDDRVTVEVRAAGPYLEFGTRPHLISPRKGRVLRWPAQGTPVTLGGRVRKSAQGLKGAYRFARSVRHPGTKAQPFLIPAARAAAAIVGVSKLIERWNKAD